MPRGDISRGGGQFSTYQIHYRNIFKSGFTLGLFASFCLPVISDAFTCFPETCILKMNGPRFDSKEQGWFKRNGPISQIREDDQVFRIPSILTILQ